MMDMSLSVDRHVTLNEMDSDLFWRTDEASFYEMYDEKERHAEWTRFESNEERTGVRGVSIRAVRFTFAYWWPYDPSRVLDELRESMARNEIVRFLYPHVRKFLWRHLRTEADLGAAGLAIVLGVGDVALLLNIHRLARACA